MLLNKVILIVNFYLVIKGVLPINGKEVIDATIQLKVDNIENALKQKNISSRDKFTLELLKDKLVRAMKLTSKEDKEAALKEHESIMEILGLQKLLGNSKEDEGNDSLSFFECFGNLFG